MPPQVDFNCWLWFPNGDRDLAKEVKLACHR
jgi:hypothetical protein